jgi:group I intron endonuclease
MEQETNCGIYQIRNLVNDKVYNGQTNDLIDREKRWSKQLKNKSKRYNQHLIRSYHKYGSENFTFNILIENLLPEQLDEYEIAMIKFTKSYDLEYGYNKTMGGEGAIPNDETLKKMSKSMTKVWEDPEWKLETIEKMKGPRPSVQGENNPNYGKEAWNHGKKCPEISERMIGNEYRKGKKDSEEMIKRKSKRMTGENNSNSELTDSKVRMIKVMLRSDIKTQAQIGKLFGVKQAAISDIKTGRRWKHVKLKSED